MLVMPTSKCLSSGAAAKSPITAQATKCIKTTKPAMPMATRRRRSALPAVIIESHSRHASRASWRANQTMVPGRVITIVVILRRPRAARASKDAAEAVQPSPFEARCARTSG